MTHSGMWPSYVPARHRRLAGLDAAGTCYDSRGNILAKGLDYAGVRALALDERLDVYVPSLTQDGWADVTLDALSDSGAVVLCSASGGPVGIRWASAGGRTAVLCSGQSWQPGTTGEVGPALLATVEAASALFGVGEYISPGALGEAHWRAVRTVTGGRAAKVACPSQSCAAAIMEHVTGGRADTLAAGETLALAYESDLRSAYPALSVGVPVGTAGRMLSEEGLPDNVTTYFAECGVTVPASGSGRAGRNATGIRAPVALAGGGGDSAGRTTRHNYSPYPGRYLAWFWREEVAACREVGWAVAPGRGWYWTRTDTANRAWLAALSIARRAASATEVASLVKRAGVAAIGRHGMGSETYTLVREEAANPATDRPVIVSWAGEGCEPFIGLWLHPEEHGPQNRLPHWFSHILMRCRLALWRRLIGEQAAGNRPLLTNFDAVLTEGPATQSVSLWDEPGTWKQTELHDVTILGPRSYVSREKGTIAPGVPKVKRRV